jgi:hypothetical protein
MLAGGGHRPQRPAITHHAKFVHKHHHPCPNSRIVRACLPKLSVKPLLYGHPAQAFKSPGCETEPSSPSHQPTAPPPPPKLVVTQPSRQQHPQPAVALDAKPAPESPDRLQLMNWAGPPACSCNPRLPTQPPAAAHFAREWGGSPILLMFSFSRAAPYCSECADPSTWHRGPLKNMRYSSVAEHRPLPTINVRQLVWLVIDRVVCRVRRPAGHRNND